MGVLCNFCVFCVGVCAVFYPTARALESVRGNSQTLCTLRNGDSDIAHIEPYVRYPQRNCSGYCQCEVKVYHGTWRTSDIRRPEIAGASLCDALILFARYNLHANNA
jgi:hypothetical protein